MQCTIICPLLYGGLWLSAMYGNIEYNSNAKIEVIVQASIIKEFELMAAFCPIIK